MENKKKFKKSLEASNEKYFKYSQLIGIITNDKIKNSFLVWLLNKNLGLNLSAMDLESLSFPDSFSFPKEKALFESYRIQLDFKKNFPIFYYDDEFNEVSYFLITNNFKNFSKIKELKRYSNILFFKTDTDKTDFFMKNFYSIKEILEIRDAIQIKFSEVRDKNYFVF